MKEKDAHEGTEKLIIWGVLVLLGGCLIAEIWRGQEVDLSQIINALAIILTGVANHIFGKNAALSKPKGEP